MVLVEKDVAMVHVARELSDLIHGHVEEVRLRVVVVVGRFRPAQSVLVCAKSRDEGRIFPPPVPGRDLILQVFAIVDVSLLGYTVASVEETFILRELT